MHDRLIGVSCEAGRRCERARPDGSSTSHVPRWPLLGRIRGGYRLARAALAAYGSHAGSQLAAAIAYRVVFSFVPFLTVLVSVLDLVLPATARERLVDWLFDAIPGTEVEASVARALAASGPSATVVGFFALGTLLWSATGMMAAIRTALRVIWNVGPGPRYSRAKLLDLALVASAGALVIVAFGLSLVAQVLVQLGSDTADAGGWNGGGGPAAQLAQVAASLVLTFVAFLLLYWLVPPVRPRLRHLWPAALLAAAVFQIVMAGYAAYLARFADFNAVYGPLGAVFAFLALVYVLAATLLFGAEIAVASERASHGQRDVVRSTVTLCE